MKRIKGMVLCLLLFSLYFGSSGFAEATYSYKHAWGNETDPANEFRTPVALAKDSSGNIYMADMGNHRIVKMDSSGKILKTMGTLGQSPGQFNMPFGIAVDREGNILVADTGNYRIQKFDSQFNYLKSWGTKGEGDNQFGFPREIAIDQQNNYYITDEFNHRIQKY